MTTKVKNGQRTNGKTVKRAYTRRKAIDNKPVSLENRFKRLVAASEQLGILSERAEEAAANSPLGTGAPAYKVLLNKKRELKSQIDSEREELIGNLPLGIDDIKNLLAQGQEVTVKLKQNELNLILDALCNYNFDPRPYSINAMGFKDLMLRLADHVKE